MSYNPIFSSADYKYFYKSITSDENLFKVLTKMGEEHNLPTADAEDRAKELMEAVANYQYVRNSVFDNRAMETLEDYLETCGSSRFDKLHILHQINFGLSLYDGNDAVSLIRKDTNGNELFTQYMKKEGDRIDSEEELKDSIKENMSHICLSSHHLRQYAQSLKTSDNVLASSKVLSKEGYKYKCIVSMQIYLKNEEFNLKEAVVTACREADIQAIANAVRIGEASQEYANKFINFIVKAGCLVGVFFLLAGNPISLAILSGSFLISKIKKPSTEALGAFVAKHRFVSDSNHAKLAAEVLDKIATYDENEEAVKEAYDIPCYETERITNTELVKA